MFMRLPWGAPRAVVALPGRFWGGVWAGICRPHRRRAAVDLSGRRLGYRGAEQAGSERIGLLRRCRFPNERRLGRILGKRILDAFSVLLN